MLSGITSVSYTQSQTKGRDTKRKADLQAIKSALNLYFQQNQKYPPADPLATTSYYSYSGGAWIPDLSPTFMNTQPKDPAQAFNFWQNMLASIGNFSLISPVFAGGGGGGCSSQAAAIAAYNTTTHKIDSVSMICYGSGYSVAPYVVFTGCSDASTVQATATAHLGGAAPPDGVGSITMDTLGSGYTCTPTVNIGPPPGTAPPPPPPPPPSTPYPLPAPAVGCGAASPVPYYYCYTVNSARSRFKLWTRLENTNDPQVSGNSGASCYDTTPPASLNYCLDAD